MLIPTGGILGVHCSHAYPHTSSKAQELLPKGLKGADLAVYSVFKSLGIDARVLPVLRQKHDEFVESEAVEGMLKYLRDGEEFEPIFDQVPRHIPIEEDAEKYWKMLYVSRKLHGTRMIARFAKERRLDMEPTMFQDTKGNYLGTELHSFSVNSDLPGEDEPIATVSSLVSQAAYPPFGVHCAHTGNVACRPNLASTIRSGYYVDFSAFAPGDGIYIPGIWERLHG